MAAPLTEPAPVAPAHTHRPGSKWAPQCQECRRMRGAYIKRINYEWAHGHRRYVAVGPVVAHIRRFTDAGWHVNSVARAAGLSCETLMWILNKGSRVTQRRVAGLICAVTVEDLYATAGDADLIPATGAARRLRALAAIGWPLRDLLGNPHAARIASRSRFVTGAMHRRVVDLYRDLAWRPGPSQRSRNYAAKMGWASPIQWSDEAIDDPAGRPDDADPWRPTDRREQVIDAVADGLDAGTPALRLAADLGFADPDNLRRVLYRYGRPDLACQISTTRGHHRTAKQGSVYPLVDPSDTPFQGGTEGGICA